MTNAIHSQLDATHTGIETEAPADALLVFILQPPEPASALERVAWSSPEAASAGSDAPVPSQGLRVETARGVSQTETRVGDDHGTQTESSDEASSGFPSPAPSSTGLRTPMDSPLASCALSAGKDDVPDIGHLFISNRTSTPGPSFATGDTIGVTRTRRVLGINKSDTLVIAQMYQLSVEILDREGDYSKTGRTTHQLFIDTGSDDTFGFGKPLEIRNMDENDNMDLEKRVDWKNLEDDPMVRVTPYHTSIPHGFDPRLSNRELRARGLTIGRIRYADNALAHLGLLEARTWVLSCYDSKEQQEREIYLSWRFGVAFGINMRLLEDPTSGMLGLGLTGIQHAYRSHSRDAVTPPSFLTVLQRKLRPVPAHRSGEEIAMFFCLRLAPGSYPGGRPGSYPIQSWMSFNVWPCDTQPPWNTSKIVVHNPGRPDHLRWAVYLRSISFHSVDAAVARPVSVGTSGYVGMPKDTCLVFVDDSHPNGLLVDLDTGTSITYLPFDAVQRMNEKLFLNESMVKSASKPEQTYEVLPQSWIFNRSPPIHIQVRYEFQGVGSTRVVAVYGPLENFAYQCNPVDRDKLEGLVFSSDKASCLGLNFFQTMYVSLHKSTDGLDFVRMAGQWPENFAQDLEEYYVAGPSSL